MGEVIIIDKAKADELSALGFQYTERNIDNKTAFVFIQTKEIMKELSSRYDNSSFLVSKNVCF